jgi:hypothetical protein
MLRTLALIAAWTLTSNILGCSGMRFSQPDGMTVEEAYGNGTDEKLSRLKIADYPSPTAREKVIPVMRPPQAFAVYVPQHADPENRLWIGDHWIFLELTKGGFFAEEVKEADPTARESVTDREVEDLKSRLPTLKKIAIPYVKRSGP